MAIVFDPILGLLRTKDTVSGYLPLTGGTLTGNLTINGGVLEVEGSSPTNSFINTSSGQFTQAGFAFYNNQSSIGNNGGVFLGAVITDAGATQTSMVMNQLDHNGAFVGGLWNIDIANKLMSANMTIYPLINNTYNLGDGSAYWQDGFISRVNVNSTAYIDGGVAGQVTLGGGLATPLTAVAAPYNIGAADSTILVFGTTTVTLPSVVGISGRQYTIKNAGSNTVTVATTSSQTIDGHSTISLTLQNEAVTVQSDGSQWWVIGQVATSIL